MSNSRTTTEDLKGNADSVKLNARKAQMHATRDKAFLAASEVMRSRGGAVKAVALRNIAMRAARSNRSSLNAKITLTMDEISEIATGVASYISEHFDLDKARKPAKHSRSSKAARDAVLLTEYYKAREEGREVSVRDLAKSVGFSKSTVQRTLAAAGIAPQRESAIALLSSSVLIAAEI